MNNVSKLISTFDKVNTLLTPINNKNTPLDFSFLINNYNLSIDLIQDINHIIKSNSEEDELSKMLFNECIKSYRPTLDTLEQLATLSSTIIKSILSLQIILTENIAEHKDNEFLIVSISDNANTEEYLTAIQDIILKLQNKSEAEISDFIEYSKGMIALNNKNKVKEA
jgi:hypothetical protein